MNGYTYWKYSMYAFSFDNKHNPHQSILDQINNAFKAEPNLASTIHGQRKIYQGCYGRRTALFPSVKSGGSIPTESRLELAHAICLEKNPQVKCFRSQALKIALGQKEFCYPDFLVKTIDNQYEVHEIKPNISSLSVNDLDKFLRLANLLHPLNITFRLIDQKSLPSNKDLQQLQHWYQRGHTCSWTKYEIEFATEALKPNKFSHSEQIYQALQQADLDPRLGDYLLFHEVITLISHKNYYSGEEV